MEAIKNEIRRLASEAMIDEVRFVDCEDIPEKVTGEFFGRQPRDFMVEGKSIVVVSTYIGAYNFDRLNKKKREKLAKTSRLVLSGFYFDVVEPLKAVRDYILSMGYKAEICDGFSEKNCIPLKPIAAKAGLGWIGKNSLLISKKYGTWQALGAIITDGDLAEVSELTADNCKDCQFCKRACPLGAVNESRMINRKRCLSNLLEQEAETKEAKEKNNGYFLAVFQRNCVYFCKSE